MKIYQLLLLSIASLLLSACAGNNPLTNVPSQHGDLSGFFSGLFHGAFMGFSFIASLFSHNISIYDVHNTGTWYNLGFILGASGFGASIVSAILFTIANIFSSIFPSKHL